MKVSPFLIEKSITTCAGLAIKNISKSQDCLLINKCLTAQQGVRLIRKIDVEM